MHIGSVRILTVVMMSEFTGIAPMKFYEYDDLFYLSMIITFLVLILILIIVAKYLPVRDIRRVSKLEKYSIMQSVITFAMILCNLFDSYFLISEHIHVNQVITAMSNFILNIILYYYTFRHIADFIDKNMYKRRMDDAKNSYEKIIIKKESIQEKISKDTLTNLYNRKFIYKIVDNYCDQFESAFAVLFIDINELKYVNDTYGHEAGDRYIKKVSCAIIEGIREIDFPARIGGDEFVVVLDKLNCKDTQMVITRIREKIHMINKSELFRISVSIGSVYVDNELAKKGRTIIFEEADSAMRRDKMEYYLRKR